MSDVSPVARPRIVRWAIGLAVFLAVLFLATGLWSPIGGFLLGLFFALVARGLWRGSAWSGYGAFLVMLVQVIAALRAEWAATVFSYAEIAWTMALTVSCGAVFFVAGWVLRRRRTSERRIVWVAPGVLLFLFHFGFRAFAIPTSSMEDTLLRGDEIVVRTIAVRLPKRGELAVLRTPGQTGVLTVKRVIALGGDRVQIKSKQVFVNGRLLGEHYVRIKTDYVDSFRDNFPNEPTIRLPNPGWGTWLRQNATADGLVVPTGKLFALGDNRDYSLDSRYLGFFDGADVVGQPLFVYFSFDDESSPGGPRPIPMLHPTSIRWSRFLRTL